MNSSRRSVNLPAWLPDTKLWACKDTTLRTFITLLFMMDDEGQVLIKGLYERDIARIAKVSDDDFQNALTELESEGFIHRWKSGGDVARIEILCRLEFFTYHDFQSVLTRQAKEQQALKESRSGKD